MTTAKGVLQSSPVTAEGRKKIKKPVVVLWDVTLETRIKKQKKKKKLLHQWERSWNDKKLTLITNNDYQIFYFVFFQHVTRSAA